MSPPAAPYLGLHVHASAYPARQREALLTALEQGRVPSSLLYQGPAQAQAWLDYHQACSPSRADPALRALYGQAFAAAAQALPAGPAHLVGLGCGGGQKDAQALVALSGPARALRYTPVDISAELVLEAALHVGAGLPALPQSPLVADLEARPALTPWLLQQEGDAAAARLFTCLGMVPNLRPEPLLDWLHGLLRPQDRVLISANLSPQGIRQDAGRILPQYDNPPAVRWYRGALAALGLAAAAPALDVQAAPTAADGSQWRVLVTARPAAVLDIALHGKPFRFGPQQPLQVFCSHRFTLQAFQAMLAAQRLSVLQQWVQPDGEEGIFLCAAPEA